MKDTKRERMPNEPFLNESTLGHDGVNGVTKFTNNCNSVH